MPPTSIHVLSSCNNTINDRSMSYNHTINDRSMSYNHTINDRSMSYNQHYTSGAMTSLAVFIGSPFIVFCSIVLKGNAFLCMKFIVLFSKEWYEGYVSDFLLIVTGLFLKVFVIFFELVLATIHFNDIMVNVLLYI